MESEKPSLATKVMGDNSYTIENEKLFAEWKNDKFHDRNSFVKDGIIDLEIWEKQSPKILCFFKEAYTNGTGEMDLTEELAGSAPYRNWWNTSRWIYAINELYKNREQKPNYYEIPNWEEGNKLLKSVAVVDIKKSKGVTLSNYNDLDAYLEHDKERLRKQMDLINPDIILCGKMFNYYKAIYSNDIFEKIEETNKCYIHNGKLIIDFWHFANRYSKHNTFNELCDILFTGNVFDRIKRLK